MLVWGMPLVGEKVILNHVGVPVQMLPLNYILGSLQKRV